jgi:hypothetical protein
VAAIARFENVPDPAGGPAGLPAFHTVDPAQGTRTADGFHGRLQLEIGRAMQRLYARPEQPGLFTQVVYLHRLREAIVVEQRARMFAEQAGNGEPLRLAARELNMLIAAYNEQAGKLGLPEQLSIRPDQVAESTVPANADVLRLRDEMVRLSGEYNRLRRLLEDRRSGRIQPLTRVLRDLSDVISQYAVATGEVVWHHDPLHPRHLTDPGRLSPEMSTELSAVLVVAKVEQVTVGRYPPLSAEQVEEVRVQARSGRGPVEIAADLVYELELRQAPRRVSRDTAKARALRAKVEFRRTLTGEYARAVPVEPMTRWLEVE